MHPTLQLHCAHSFNIIDTIQINMQPNMQKYQLTQEEMISLLNKTKYGVLSTIGQDGFPYGVPVNFVYLDGKIYIHGRKKGEKVDNITNNCRCCFTVAQEYGYEYTGEHACDTTTVYESVIIKGCAKLIDDMEVKKKVLLATVDKIVPGRTNMDEKKISPTGIYEIEIKSMTGKYHRPCDGAKIVQ